jgi:uncharacterized protein YneF (UPF0154 family)
MTLAVGWIIWSFFIRMRRERKKSKQNPPNPEA